MESGLEALDLGLVATGAGIEGRALYPRFGDVAELVALQAGDAGAGVGGGLPVVEDLRVGVFGKGAGGGGDVGRRDGLADGDELAAVVGGVGFAFVDEGFVEGGVVVVVVAAGGGAAGEGEAGVGGTVGGDVLVAVDAEVVGLGDAHGVGGGGVVLAVAGDALVGGDGAQAVGVARVGELGLGVGVAVFFEVLGVALVAGVGFHAHARGVADLAVVLDLVVAAGGGAGQEGGLLGRTEKEIRGEAGRAPQDGEPERPDEGAAVFHGAP